MREFDELLKVAERLNGPDGCPWDRTQTFHSLQPYLLEEVHETIEAVDLNEDAKIIEELGDLLYTIIFYCKIAKKEKRFAIEDVLTRVREKLIQRHPHVFGETKAKNVDEVIHKWEERKLQEKAHQQRKSALDGIPETLPLLAKAQKMVSKILRKAPTFFAKPEKSANPEDQIASELLTVIQKAQQSGIDAESALRRATSRLEQEFRASE